MNGKKHFHSEATCSRFATRAILALVLVAVWALYPLSRDAQAAAEPGRILPAVIWNIPLDSGDVAVGSDGDPVILVAPSSTADFHVAKLHGDTGVTLWDIQFDGGGYEQALSVAVGPDGNPVVTGSTDIGGTADYLTVKLDGANGSILWSTLFDDGNCEWANSVAIGPDNSVYVTGLSENPDNLDIRTLKLDGHTGQTLWDATYDQGFDEDTVAVAVGPDGNPVIAGVSQPTGSRIVKYDSTTGAIIWDTPVADDNFFVYGIAVGSDGNPVVTGDNFDILTVKVDGASGAEIWSQTTNEYGSGYDVVVMDNGDSIVTGSRTVRYDGVTGEILWVLTQDSGMVLDGRGIAKGPDDSLFVAGQSLARYGGAVTYMKWVDVLPITQSGNYSGYLAVGPDGNPVVTGTENNHFRTTKYAGGSGDILWDSSLDCDIEGCAANAVAVGPDGHPVATGDIFTGGYSDLRIVKYDGATGAVLWDITFDTDNSESGSAVAVGPDGHPVIASFGANGSGWLIVKVNDSTGAEIWRATFDSGGDDFVAAIAIGQDGQPVIAGTSNENFRVLKLDGATGSVLSDFSYDSGYIDRATGLAIGPDGNPVVTGDFCQDIQYGHSGYRICKARTLKFNGATGAILWNVVYDNTPDDHSWDVAVGQDGNPVVTVRSYGSVENSFVRTLRYDGTTGALLSAYTFDTGNEEYSSAVVVGPDGNPVIAVGASYSDFELWMVKYLIEVATPAGSPISVALNGGTQSANGASVTFSQVTGSGTTSLSTSSTGPALPGGFSLGDRPTYFDFNTTAIFTPPVTVCIGYDPTAYTSPDSLHLLFYESSAWVDVTAFNDTGNSVICGQVNSFSLFAIAERPLTPPVAVDDAYSVDEDNTLTVAAPGVLGNDSDVDGDELTAILVAGPTNGTLTLNSNGSLSVILISDASHGTLVLDADGSFTYTPNPDWNGTDSFTYVANDGTNDSNVATVSLVVNPINDEPVSLDDAGTTLEDVPVTLDVLANDSDVEDDTLAFDSLTQPANGTAVINPDKTITYTPNPDFNGEDSYTYTAADGNGGYDTATVNISVVPVNDVPVAVNDAGSTAEDAPVAVSVLGNDTDIDGDSLAVAEMTQPTNGMVATNPDGTVTYTPDADWNGTDSFAYTVCDDGVPQLCSTAAVAITVTPINDSPVAFDNAYSLDEDTSLTVLAPGVLGNDADVDGDGLTASDYTQPAHGTLTQNSDGSLTYTPKADYYGEDSYTYTISDGNGGADTATVTLTIVPVNDTPVVVDDAYATPEDTPIVLDTLANDTDVDGDSLTVDSVTQPAYGTVTINLDGTVTYTPDADWSGADSFAYTVCDDGDPQLCDEGVVTITVTSLNDNPIAIQDQDTTSEDTPVTTNVLVNDLDLDGDELTVINTTAPAHGTVTDSPSGLIVYTPDANYNGEDSYTYTVSDGNGGTDTATVIITVSSINDAPLAADDAYATSEDTAATFDVLGNDSDIDGDNLTVTAVIQPINGVVTITPDGALAWTPDVNWNGTDSFVYTVCDDGVPQLCSTAAVTLTVAPVNDNPVGLDDTYSLDEDTSLTVPAPGVLGNDLDVDGDSLIVSGFTQPAHGTLTQNADGSFTYTPQADYHGEDGYTYTVSDGYGGADMVTVTLTVASVNDVPVAVDDTATTQQDIPITLDLLSNDTDIDGDYLTVTSVTQPAHGTTTINLDGTVNYMPDTDWNGTDTFTYSIVDGHGGVDTAAVTITVTPGAVAFCDLYPIALHTSSLQGIEAGGFVNDVLNGTQPGNFGWLTWTGSNGTPALIASLTLPGDSDTYVNPYDSADHIVSVGDWVQGRPGAPNAKALRNALDALKGLDIVVPVWDVAEGSGANARYRVVRFALIRITDYHLPGQNRITARFLGYVICGE